MNFIKFVRIFLLILIVIGIGLLLTQKMWVPKVVDGILGPQAVVENSSEDKNTQSNKKIFISKGGYSFEYPSNYIVDRSDDPIQEEILELDESKKGDPHYGDPRYTTGNSKTIFLYVPERYNYHVDLTNASEEVLLKDIKDWSRGFCEAAGAGPVDAVGDIAKQTKITNKNNITYYETYYKYYYRGDEYAGIVGPIYSMKLPYQNALLFIHAPFSDCYPRPTIEPSQTIVLDILENFSILGA